MLPMLWQVRRHDAASGNVLLFRSSYSRRDADGEFERTVPAVVTFEVEDHRSHTNPTFERPYGHTDSGRRTAKLVLRADRT